MDPSLLLLGKIAAAFALLSLVIRVCCRAVRWARKRPPGGELIGTALTFFSFGGALNPGRELAEERRKLKRSEEGSGDPDPLDPAREAVHDQRLHRQDDD